jgi:hypothetical protein
MSNFLRHIGKIGDRKVAVIFREVPGEPHMALIVYTETLNAHLHDALMKCLESDIGQNSENLAEALSRQYTVDGKVILQVLHVEGILKKVQTSQVIMTPNSSTSIKLEELNKMLDEMQQGEKAVQRMSEIDQSRGLQDPADVARRMRGEQTADIVSDATLAQQRLAQAQKMEREAKGLLAESKRLLKEARELDPTVTPIEEPASSASVVPVKRKSRANVTAN